MPGFFATYPTRVSLKISLKIIILGINFLGLVCSTLNWSWLKWDQQLEKIWNLSVSPDEADVKDIEWLKTILSRIVVVRFVISRVSFVAYVANIYTILTQSWQNLLILWMVLSFTKDIVLEVIIIVTTSLLWRKGNVATSHFVEFIVTKTIWLAVSTWKWYTTFKWYTQLRKAAKIRKFAIIARTSLTHVSGRAGYSLDEECLDIAITRQGTYKRLKNLIELPGQSLGKANFELRTYKSLTTLITNDSRNSESTNDYDAHANDFSVAEKSMKMLNVTAEDVMDACSRIQERSYRSEQDETVKMPSSMEQVLAQFSLEEAVEGTDDTLRKGQTTADGVETAADRTLREKNLTKTPLIEEKRETNVDGKIVSADREDKILVFKKEEEPKDFSLAKDSEATRDEARDRVKSVEPREQPLAVPLEVKEKAQTATKIVQCPSSARSTEVKPCSSLVRKMEAKYRSIYMNHKDKLIETVDEKRHPCRTTTKLVPLVPINLNNKERGKSLKASSYACRCISHANTDVQRNDKRARSSDIDDKKKLNTGKKEFRRAVPKAVARKNETDGSYAMRYLRDFQNSRKQVQTSQGYSRKPADAWNSVPSGQIARPAGYEKRSVAVNKASFRQTNVQTETLDISRDSLSTRHSWRRSIERMQHGRTIGLGSIYDLASFKRNYAVSGERESIESRTLTAYNDLLKNKRDSREKHEFPSSRKLPFEKSETVEVRALRAYNELAKLEDKKKLETRKEYEDSSEEHEASEMRALGAYDALLEDTRETAAIAKYNLSRVSDREQSIKDPRTQTAYNEFTLPADEGEPKAGTKYDSFTRRTTSSEREDAVEIPMRVPDHLSKTDRDVTSTRSLETCRNESSNFRSSDARQTRMPLNLREVTRNIKWTPHPRGIVLANKNLHGQFPTNGRLEESRQRDIVNGDTANALHGAFFFKPKIVMRIFQRARARILPESLPNLRTFRRLDFQTEFACRVNNEMFIRDQDSLFNFNLERILGNQNNPEGSLLPDASDDRVAREGGSRDLCIIFIEREEASSESETMTMEDSTATESRDDAHTSIEDSLAPSVLTIDEDHRWTDRSTNDNLPVQLIVDMLRNFGIEVLDEITPGAPTVERIDDGEASNASTSDDEQLQRLMQLANSRITLGNGRERSFASTATEGDDELSRNVEALSSSGIVPRGSATSDNEDRDVYEVSEFTTNSNEGLQQNDSYNSEYDGRDESEETPVSLDNGSLMEEFSRESVIQ